MNPCLFVILFNEREVDALFTMIDSVFPIAFDIVMNVLFALFHVLFLHSNSVFILFDSPLLVANLFTTFFGS